MRRSMSEPRTALQPRRRVKEPASTVGHAKRPAMILRSAPASSMHSAKLVTMERATRRGSASNVGSRRISGSPRELKRQVSQHARRSEEHTSELQSLMRISYAVFCLKKKNTIHLTDQQAYER